MFFKDTEELFPESFHLFQSFFFEGFQCIPIVLDAVLVLQGLSERFPFGNVLLVEDVPSEILDFIGYLPLLVVADTFLDVVEQPIEDRGVSVQFLNHGIYRFAQCGGIVQFNVQVGTQFQFARQVTHHRLEKRVDGFYPEPAIIMNHQLECLASLFAYVFFRKM